ncbi:hypothetical protein NKI86_19320 [Mesorhizobium sp. M0320]|uniref:hypothetical protein n=1 Tax=Mesorhizobium sp. M0320 TaxID=2956936 RepID=UPI00333ABA1C
MTVQPSPFIPGADASNPRWTGKRKKIQRSAAIHMRWGSTFKECEEAFADWHHCALQIVHAENISFRLLAFVRQHLNMKAGTISGTNFEFAKMGGGCSIKTISREIGLYERLGLFIVSRCRHKIPGSGINEVRTLRLALPTPFNPKFTARGEEP